MQGLCENKQQALVFGEQMTPHLCKGLCRILHDLSVFSDMSVLGALGIYRIEMRFRI